MRFQHSPEIWRDFPELVAGVLLINRISIDASVAAAVAEFGATAASLHTACRRRRRRTDTRCGAEHLRQPPLIAAAYGATVRALAALITTSNEQITALEGQAEACFGQHPDAEIYLSQPGLGAVLGARVLAEFGDDHTRYAGARARKNYAGTSPITRASGKKTVVLARYVRNNRLADALHQQAFQRPERITGSPRLLRLAQGPRHRLQRSPAPAWQPPRRHPARLPQNAHPLRRGRCLEPAHPTGSSLKRWEGGAPDEHANPVG